MTLDPLDQAFVDRWQRRQAGIAVVSDDAAAAPSRPSPAAAPAAAAPSSARADRPPPTADGLIGRLLLKGQPQWAALADELEAARLAGHRVIAIAGGERGEGRSTLATCLAQTLRERGREVVLIPEGDAAAGEPGEPRGGGRPHDKRIVLLDAGVWFRPGPIRRQRLAVASLGCDAAILVRRADRPSAPARAAALAAVGVAVLGEVLTFALAATVAAADPGAEPDR